MERRSRSSIEKFPRGVDGGLAVDGSQRTLGPHASSVFAAGDCASMEHRELSMHSGDGTVNQWFQMRLWSQARQSGTFAARGMCGECDESAWGFNYELFTHQTTFFGMKCVFLGCYNGQKLGAVDERDIRTYSRTGVDADGNATFARVLLAKGAMRGAVLVGDVESAETFENLILDGIDLTRFGPTLLDPEIDIDDYFD